MVECLGPKGDELVVELNIEKGGKHYIMKLDVILTSTEDEQGALMWSAVSKDFPHIVSGYGYDQAEVMNAFALQVLNASRFQMPGDSQVVKVTPMNFKEENEAFLKTLKEVP